MDNEYLEITLSNKITVKVYPVPPFVYDYAMAKVEAPKIPKRPVNPEVALPGTNAMVDDPEDPEYLEKLDIYNMESAKVYLNVRLLTALRDVEAPDIWPKDSDKELWDYLGIVPTDMDKPIGRKLSYIKLTLLASRADLDLVLTVADAVGATSRKEVDSIITSFRRNRFGPQVDEIPVQKGQSKLDEPNADGG